jgi:uncharacterized delta-60 repeat protein
MFDFRPHSRPRLRIERLEDRVTPAFGLDPTFGDGGQVTLPTGAWSELQLAALPGPDVLVATRTPGGPVLTRVTPTGAATAAAANLRLFVQTSVHTRPDGKVLVAGYGYPNDTEAFVPEYPAALYQLNADGSIDTTFGNNGYVFVGGEFGTHVDGTEFQVAVLADGSVLAAAGQEFFDVNSQPQRFVTVRKFTATGGLDTTFGDGGTARVPLPAAASSTLSGFGGDVIAIANVLADADGRIVVAGSTFQDRVADGFVIRLRPNGARDAGWGTDGLLELSTLLPAPSNTEYYVSDVVDTARGLVVQIAGKYTAAFLAVIDAGISLKPPRDELIRLTPTGTLDPTFGDSGRARTSLATLRGYDAFRSSLAPPDTFSETTLVQLPDGRFVVAGSDHETSEGETVVDRFAAVEVFTADGASEQVLKLATERVTGEQFYQSSATPTVMDLLLDGDRLLAVYGANGRGGTFEPYQPFRQDVRVAALVDPQAPALTLLPAVPGDLNGDRVAETVRVVDTNRLEVTDGKTGAVLVAGYQPYEERYKGGLSWDAGDLDGDGKSEIAVCAQAGGSARVVVLRLSADGAALEQVHSFFGIADANFRGGGTVAIGRYLAAGTQLAVGAGKGGGPRVTVYDGTTLAAGLRPEVVDNFMAFEDANFRGGCFVDFVPTAGGDALAVGAGVGGAPRVQVFQPAAGTAVVSTFPVPRTVIANAYLGDPTSRTGIDPAAAEEEVRALIGS